jgi:hypothetical protein
MKKMILLVIVLSAGSVSFAQLKPGLVRQAEVKSLTVAKESTVVGYESTIAPGRLSLAKVFTPSDGEVFKMGYTITHLTNKEFNNSKPVKIGLSRKSFDSVFTHGSAEMVGKYPALNRYINENKIQLDQEKGWIAVINYFNNL